MLQLVYASTARHHLEVANLAVLLAQARVNNQRDEITGLLVTDSKRFMQVLEGPKEAVEDTFLRIIADNRHHGLTVISRRIICKREFGNWDMAYLEDKFENQDYVQMLRNFTHSAPLFIQQSFLDLI